MISRFLPGLMISVFAAWIAPAATLHVNLNSTNPVPPFSDWSTASTNIQVAVDGASPGDRILVTNGIYSVGGKAVPGLPGSSSRVVVDKALTLESVNGPEVTFIVGSGRMGGFVRGVYLTNGAVLAGFTITNGTPSEQVLSAGGGVYCPSTQAVVSNCVIVGNASSVGGGVYRGTLLSCTIFGNSANNGGGAYQSIAVGCAISANSAANGGGAAESQLAQCTVTGNSASVSGGGAFQSTLNNSIVYYNTAPAGANTAGSTLNYSCTTPLPPAGAGNIDSEPQLASLSHLSFGSPCRGAGNTSFASGKDIDGEPWANPPSMGCDENWPGETKGEISVIVLPGVMAFAKEFSVAFTGRIHGQIAASVWDFGDGTVLSNRPYASHAWTQGGDFPVVLTAYNDHFPGGISATAVVHVVGQPIHYVSLDSTNPVAPYTSWETAATDIQSAVDAATAVGESVVVSNGVYRIGGRPQGSGTTNRVVIPQKIRVSSVNGPLVTVIEGQRATGTGGLGPDAVRCVHLVGGAVLDGFTLTNGATVAFDLGGGVYCSSGTSVVTNCILSANYAHLGGGSYSGTFIDCLFQFNSAYSSGGGSYFSVLNHCTLYNNGAVNNGGGAYFGTLNDCTLSRNAAINYGGGMASSTMNRCTLEHNTAEFGGGSYSGTANDCRFTSNYGYSSGGGLYNTTANRCVFSGNGCGSGVQTGNGGGAAYFGTLNSCIVTNNHASWNGGGTFNSVVNNSLLAGNDALYGGGANGGTLKNCTVTGNQGFFSGGGVYQSTLHNCILYFNLQASNTNNYSGANTFQYSCTTPDPGSGAGNITNEPAFAALAPGDFRLQPESPCINSGRNSLSAGQTDLDGNPRFSGGTVDIGAYEFQNPASVLSLAWAQAHGLATDGSADFLDPDGDHLNNWGEWIAGVNPVDAASVLVLQPPSAATNGPGLQLTWQSVNTRAYLLQRRMELGSLPGFSTILSNITGMAGATTVTDPTATNGGPYFYRVGVQ